MDNDKAFDDFLGISTGEEVLNGLQVTTGAYTEDDNPYQATYYNDLVQIFDRISMEPEDKLVDFGCGLGRVLFYVNSRHYCKVAGIESNREIYDRLLQNAAGYQSKFLEQEDRMFFHYLRADEYEITPEDNFFYFFNPFSGETFGRVIDNIIASARENPRDMQLIVYYPTYEILREIKRVKLFIQKGIIKLSHYEEDPDEKAYIFYLSRYVL